jgi:hypothetical protein
MRHGPGVIFGVCVSRFADRDEGVVLGFLAVAAVSAAAVAGAIGVNTHLDFQSSAYQNLPVTEKAIEYLGVRNLRDSAQVAEDLTIWPKVAKATGTKFDDYMGEGSPALDTADLAYVARLAGLGVLNAVEGGDENDNSYAVAQGNSIAWTAKFQRQVYATGHALGLPVINMSFGAGWTWLNDWRGDYGKVGNLSPYADYANAHTYQNVGATPDATILMLDADALLAAKSRPVVTTEIGWNTAQFSQHDVARFALDAVFDAVSAGNARLYFYALFDDGSGAYGLMNANGSSRPAGAAVHNLTTILADSGTPRPGSLSYSLSALSANDRTLLMEKANGAFELAVWNETAAAHMTTLRLAAPASAIHLYDPLTGSGIKQTALGTQAITFQVPNHPVIVEVIPAK